MDEQSDVEDRPAGPALDHARVPFNKPSIAGREVELMRTAIEQGYTSAEGPFTAEACELLRDATGASEVLLTTSCTAALEMTALLLDVGPDDTVVVPSFGFVTTALAYARQGAKVLFCDIEPETLGLDPDHLTTLLDDTVRAVVPIHYSGVGCDLAGIEAALDPWPNAALVEDNAHGLFGTYRGTPLGSHGRFATLSFHETKNFVCGEGGALLVNDPSDVDRARVIYQKGTDRTAFLLGQVDKYSWQDTGSSFGMSDVLAAYLVAQLERRAWILGRRRHVFDRYAALLADGAAEHGYRLPVVPADRGPAYHMFHILLESRAQRDHVLGAMNEDGYVSTFHYVPLHSSPHGRRVAARPTDCPVTDDLSGRLLRMPFFNELTDDQIDGAVESFLRAVATAPTA